MTTPRAYLAPLLSGLPIGGLAFVFGVPLHHAVLLGLVPFAAAPLLRSTQIELHDRPGVPRSPRRKGTRRELTELTRSRHRRSRGVEHEAVRQLAAAARRRLGDLGIDADDPAQGDAARRALGSLAHGVLITRSSQPPIPERTFARCLDAVDRLADGRREREVGVRMTDGRAR